ncbi:Ran GTPase [Cynara cardunculus var. scolymus]|uniref:Ran GTPase n=1 Tax=Cynara cardunculus var. scolymus TaxID=59895 RepID=A0A103Y9P5_CYNCS|nr:Ran GTPase [Cynara cardunculus var. scolymus]
MGSSLLDDECDYLFKTVLIGDSAVGKSNLLSRFAKDEFHLDSKPTIGVEFAYRNIKVGDKMVKAQIWDTAGQERVTFENLRKWLHELREYGNRDMVIVLVGNKTDLVESREVEVRDGQSLAQVEDLCFMETSAKENLNVEDAFLQMITKIFEIASQKSLEAKENEASKQVLEGRKEIIYVVDEVTATKHTNCCTL